MVIVVRRTSCVSMAWYKLRRQKGGNDWKTPGNTSDHTTNDGHNGVFELTMSTDPLVTIHVGRGCRSILDLSGRRGTRARRGTRDYARLLVFLVAIVIVLIHIHRAGGSLRLTDHGGRSRRMLQPSFLRTWLVFFLGGSSLSPRSFMHQALHSGRTLLHRRQVISG